jgi:hypothetical protein
VTFVIQAFRTGGKFATEREWLKSGERQPKEIEINSKSIEFFAMLTLEKPLDITSVVVADV